MSERAFSFLRLNERGRKPRTRGLTEIRGPYYTAFGKRHLDDVLETMGAYIDTFKFAGGSFVLMGSAVVRELIEICHSHDVAVSTGGFLEYVLAKDPDAVGPYLKECVALGFDIVEVSSGFLAIDDGDLVRLTKRARDQGLRVNAEVGIQFGVGGASSVRRLEGEPLRDPGRPIELARRQLEAGAEMIMIESEGITEQVREWRTDVVERVVADLGLARVMFEAADPEVFGWYLKSYGPGVNLFIDHSQIVQLECLRSGIWGTHDLWGRVRTYGPS